MRDLRRFVLTASSFLTMVGVMGYPGGKGRMWQNITALMPPHSVYIETHLGKTRPQVPMHLALRQAKVGTTCRLDRNPPGLGSCAFRSSLKVVGASHFQV